MGPVGNLKTIFLTRRLIYNLVSVAEQVVCVIEDPKNPKYRFSIDKAHLPLVLVDNQTLLTPS